MAANSQQLILTNELGKKTSNILFLPKMNLSDLLNNWSMAMGLKFIFCKHLYKQNFIPTNVHEMQYESGK